MGRGLSDLQRRILAAAYRQRGDEPIRFQARAYWLMPQWLHELAIEIHDVQQRFWRIGNYALSEGHIEGGYKFDTVLNLEDETPKLIKKALEAAKAAADTDDLLWMGEPNNYTELLRRQRRWIGKKTGIRDDPEFEVGGYAISHGQLVCDFHSVADFAESADAHAMKDKLETALRGFEQFASSCVTYSSGFKAISYNELLAELFDFPVSGHLNSQAFDVQKIGAGRYNAARASLHRACLRLAQRKLIERRPQADLYDRAGINLTPEGVAAAEGAGEAKQAKARPAPGSPASARCPSPGRSHAPGQPRLSLARSRAAMAISRASGGRFGAPGNACI